MKEQLQKTDLLWARILVKINIKSKFDSITLITGDRSFSVQIWWEIRPTVAEVISNSSRAIGDPAETGEEDDRETARRQRTRESCKGSKWPKFSRWDEGSGGICLFWETVEQ